MRRGKRGKWEVYYEMEKRTSLFPLFCLMTADSEAEKRRREYCNYRETYSTLIKLLSFRDMIDIWINSLVLVENIQLLGHYLIQNLKSFNRR